MWRRFSDRPLIQRMTGDAAAQTEPERTRSGAGSTACGSLTFLFLGTTNLFALRYLDDDGWMNFKLYFTPWADGDFVVAQGISDRRRGRTIHDKPARAGEDQVHARTGIQLSPCRSQDDSARHAGHAGRAIGAGHFLVP